ncbi:MAG: aspartyl protease family protein, partial [Candidatus Eremiobacteraeota bacterium]|nr:aspartyl protease family protein [Candidatus Eremiobacteraeota bacterium]
MRLALRTTAAAFAFLFCAGGQGAAATSTRSVMDALRRAMLTRPVASIGWLHAVGNIDVVGIRGRMQEWDDVRGVRFTTDQNAGALSGASGWDGKVAWSQDYAGLVTIDGGETGRLQALDQAYIDNLRYLRPDAGAATVVYAGRRNTGGKNYDVLALTPPHGSELDFWIDQRTHLIDRIVTQIGIISITTTFSDYRRVDGITYPFASVVEESSGNGETIKITSLDINQEVADRMRVPGQNVHDFSVAGGSTTVPVQIVNNHVYVQAMLGGRGPYTLILDSGGDYIVTPQVAQALQAKSSGGLQLQGVGNATEGASFARLASIAIGGAVVRSPYALVLPIATGFGVAEGMRIDGMIGYQLLARFLTTIDYANAKLTLAAPTSAPASAAGAAAIPFYISGMIPRIPIDVDGVATTAEVDTGNRAGLELSSPFIAAHPAIGALAKTAPGVTGFGVGGPSTARLGRIPTLQIGPYAIANSIASFVVQSKGALADPFNPANIGGAIWRRFVVTFDYAHQQLWLTKGPAFDAPAPQDRSGLFLIDDDGAYTVISVLPGSPGAAANLVKGDIILSVNGGPASL